MYIGGVYASLEGVNIELMTLFMPLVIDAMDLFSPVCTVKKSIFEDLVCRNGSRLTKKKSTYSCMFG